MPSYPALLVMGVGAALFPGAVYLSYTDSSYWLLALPPILLVNLALTWWLRRDDAGMVGAVNMALWRNLTPRYRSFMVGLAVWIVLASAVTVALADTAPIRVVFLLISAQSAFYAGLALASRPETEQTLTIMERSSVPRG